MSARSFVMTNTASGAVHTDDSGSSWSARCGYPYRWSGNAVEYYDGEVLFSESIMGGMIDAMIMIKRSITTEST